MLHARKSFSIGCRPLKFKIVYDFPWRCSYLFYCNKHIFLKLQKTFCDVCFFLGTWFPGSTIISSSAHWGQHVHQISHKTKSKDIIWSTHWVSWYIQTAHVGGNLIAEAKCSPLHHNTSWSLSPGLRDMIHHNLVL